MRYLYPLLFALLLNGNLFAMRFEHITSEVGLSSNRTFSIEKSRDGFMWFSTKKGVDRYDGNGLKFYSLPDNYSSSKDNVAVNKLVMDAHNNLWAFTNSGIIYRYSVEHDQFEIFCDLREEVNVPMLNITNLIIETPDSVLVSTFNGLFLLSGRGQGHKPAVTKLIGGTVMMIAKVGDELLLARDDNSTGVYTVSNGKLERVNSPLATLFSRYHMHSVYVEPTKKVIWLGTMNSGFYKIDYSSEPLVQKIEGIKNTPIRSVKPYNRHHLLIGSDGNGMYLLDKNSLTIVNHFTSDDDLPNSLNGNGVYDIFVDELHKIWVATYTGGISMHDPDKPRIEVIKHNISDNNSLVNNDVNAILEDSKGNMWYATNNGISLYEKRAGRWISFFNKSHRGGYDNNVFLTLSEDSNRQVWAGGYGVGVIAINIDNHTIKSYVNDKNNINSLGTNNVYASCRDSKGLMWFGGRRGKLSCYNPKSNTFTQFNVDDINVITEKSDDELFIGTFYGLYIFNKNSGVALKIDFPSSLSESKYLTLPITSLSRSGENLWIGTLGYGLLCYNYGKDNLTIYNALSGLSSDNVYGVIPETDNKLWLSTERGLNVLYTDDNQVDVYGLSDGLPSEQFIDASFCRSLDGALYFGTQSGVAALRMSDFAKRKQTKKGVLRFTDFVVYNQSILSDESEILSKPLDSTAKVKLRHNQNFFTIEFTEINFNNPEQILYSYKLSGIDSKWSTPSPNHRAVYTNIPEGEYKFTVRSYMGSKASGEREITIHVDTAWWNSIVARLLYFLIVIGLLWFVYRFFKQRIEQRHNSEKMHFFINTAHDIRTPLTLIKAPLIDLESDETLCESSRTNLNIALNNTNKLTRFVNQLLDFQKADLNQMRLILSEHNISEFIAERVDNYRSVAHHKDIKISIHLPEQSAVACFDHDKMDKIIDNLLSNAIKYTQPQGEVTVKVRLEKQSWTVEVSDTGIGIPKGSAGKLFKQFYRADNAINSKETGSGIGLVLTKSLVELHSGTIVFSDNDFCGSTFRVTFPYFRDELTQNAQDNVHEPCDEVQQSTNAKVMIVEDNDELRSYLAQSFSQNYQVYQFSDGQQALSALRRVNPEIVISDVMMPNLSGDKLCEKIKSNIETSHIPVILLTALGQRSDMVSGLELGADDYITKPFDIVVLKSKVKSIINNRKMIRQRYLSDSQDDSAAEYSSQIDRDFLAKASEYIERNIADENLSINEICQSMAMSRTLFYNKITAFTGQAPNEFIRVMRMKQAGKLLKTGRYNIGEVAVMVGIPDTKYFSKRFKLFYGVSPKDF